MHEDPTEVTKNEYWLRRAFVQTSLLLALWTVRYRQKQRLLRVKDPMRFCWFKTMKLTGLSPQRY